MPVNFSRILKRVLICILHRIRRGITEAQLKLTSNGGVTRCIGIWTEGY